jgi:hypothetical protein
MHMKTKVLLGLLIMGLIAACTNKQGAVPNASLTGKWKYTGSRQSNAGPQYWVPATNSSDYLQLNANGTMQWTPGNEYKKYTLTDSVTVTMMHADGSNYQNYYYKIKGDLLSISPSGPIMCY